MLSILIAIAVYLASGLYLFPDAPMYVNVLFGVSSLIITQLLVIEHNLMKHSKNWDLFLSMMTEENADGSRWALAHIKVKEDEDDNG